MSIKHLSKNLQEQDKIYKNILQNIQDGVITINLEGKIMTFNQSASEILTLNEESVVGKNLSQLFFSDIRNDEFNDVILKAVYESSVTHHKEICYYTESNKCKNLSISATFLFKEVNGKSEKWGVILVISDVSERHRLDYIQNLFGKYIDPRIAQRLMHVPGSTLLKPDKQFMTVSFCDMRSFSVICENLPPDILVEIMNFFFEDMSIPIYKNFGVIDKYIGDAMLSFWGESFTENENHAVCACLAALEQLIELTNLNIKVTEFLKKKYPHFILKINIRIGVATGDLVVGNIGSENFKNYTIMGNVVNLAARLVGANKVYGTSALVSNKTATEANVAFEFREIDTIRTKGKDENDTIYELLGLKGSLDEKTLQLRNTYSVGLNYYRQRLWDQALLEFNHCLKINPEDTASQVFVQRLEYFKKNPPLANWDCVWVMESK